MLVAQLLSTLERRAPGALAEEWDNVGLMVGRHNQPVRRVLVALELRDTVVGEALEAGCDAILTHHPPIFPSLDRLTDDSVAGAAVLRAAESRMAVLAAHTNLDSAVGGLNDIMAELLGMGDTRPLRPASTDAAAGLGRVGRVAATTLGELAAHVAAAFPGPVTYTGEPWGRVETIACCTGSGASLLGDAAAAEVDVYVTGDLKYHDADRAGTLALVDVPHAGVEQKAMRMWARGLERALATEGVEVRFAEADTDPWQTA